MHGMNNRHEIRNQRLIDARLTRDSTEWYIQQKKFIVIEHIILVNALIRVIFSDLFS